MRRDIILAPAAVESFRRLRARDRSEVRDALERHLRFEPTKVSKSRIKRLRGVSRPHFRLRIGDIRVFYDITETTVDVLAIIPKAEAQGWPAREGTANPGGGAGEGQG
jgi:mRNA-degrading endonuclease RelE of RelBE toxin-antitoxin system